MRSFTDSDLPDTDNTVPFVNTTLINQNKKGKIKEHSRLITLIEVNERTHADQQNIKFSILGFAGSADELIRQSANCRHRH